MYTEMHRSLRITKEMFNPSVMEYFKQRILAEKYMKMNESAMEEVNLCNSTMELFELFGLVFISYDVEYPNWSKIQVNTGNLQTLESVLKDCSECFEEDTSISVRDKEKFMEYTMCFNHKEDGFVAKPIPIAVTNERKQSWLIYIDGKDLYNIDGSDAHSVVPSTELWDMISKPWSLDSISYIINLRHGLYVCEYNVCIYDGVSVGVFGYGHSPEEALQDCKYNTEKLKSIAYDSGYSLF